MSNLWLSLIFSSIILGFVSGLHYLIRYYKNALHDAFHQANLKSQKFYAALSASLDGIIIIDLQGRILEFSEAAEQIFGYKRDDVIGEFMFELIVPERYREAHNAGMARLEQTGTAKILGQRIEIEALRANGEEFMSELAVSRSQSEHADIFIAFIRDISAAKEAEKALIDAKRKAEDASNVKSKFLAAMSHEIRTPFNAVLSILDILKDTPLSKDQSELIETASNSSHALLAIINDTLDYAKITSGAVSLVNKPFKADSLFNDVKNLFDPVANEKGLTLKIYAQKFNELYLEGDAGRIKQILINFVSNAIKFTEHGEIELILNVSQTAAQKQAGIYDLFCGVKDQGIGISSQKQGALFDEFYMVDTTDTREHNGTGLGLAISRRLTTMMAGHIGVKSDVNEGALFWVSLPLPITPKPVFDFENEAPPIAIDIRGRKILLAEDNKTNQMVIGRILDKYGVDLTVVDNGQAAVDTLKKQDFDLILMDISMPVMGGLQATRLIRERAGDKAGGNSLIPIIALTAMASSDESAVFIKAGMNAVLVKPVSQVQLTQTIQLFLGDQTTVPLKSSSEATDSKSGPKSGIESDPNYLENIDSLAVKSILDGLTAQQLTMFRDQFQSDLSAALQDLSRAIKTDDILLAERASHTIKGLSATYGFLELSEISGTANQHCKPGPSSETSWVKLGQQSELCGQAALDNLNAVFDLAELKAG